MGSGPGLDCGGVEQQRGDADAVMGDPLTKDIGPLTHVVDEGSTLSPLKEEGISTQQDPLVQFGSSHTSEVASTTQKSLRASGGPTLSSRSRSACYKFTPPFIRKRDSTQLSRPCPTVTLSMLGRTDKTSSYPRIGTCYLSRLTRAPPFILTSWTRTKGRVNSSQQRHHAPCHCKKYQARAYQRLRGPRMFRDLRF